MFYKIRTHYKHTQGKIFAWMSLILGLAITLIHPVLPNFIKTIVHTDSNVSLFYSFLAVVILIAGLTSGFVLKKIKRTTLVKIGFALLATVTFLLIFVTKFMHLAVLITLKTWIELILFIILGLFVRDFAKANNLGKEEGLKFRFQNIGALVGLFLGGFLAAKFDYEIVFISTAIVAIFGLGYFHQKHVIEKHPAIINAPEHGSLNLLNNLKEFFSNSERVKSYLIYMSHVLWISFKYLYIPLYVVNSGYLSSMSGLILSIAMFPVIVFESKMGELAGMYGIRKLITIGFLIIGIVLAVIFVSPFPLLNFGLLAVANVGGAFIEPLRETLFLNNTPKEKENDFYGVYVTSEPIAGFLTPIIGIAVLAFLPFKFLFLVFGILMILAGYFSWATLKHS